ncbi:MAG: hypothetical protein H6727_04900 [Myxococcales bacterium]|nr:hypothetical protein [Myxococcales bacterium]
MLRKMMLMLCAVGALGLVACGTPTPTCATGEVLVGSACKKSCTEDADCGEGMVCHKDETPAHCDAKE